MNSSGAEDVYLISRLLMMFYWLGFPFLIILGIYLSTWFSGFHLADGPRILRRFSPYIHNLGVFLFFAIIFLFLVNSFIFISYIIDIFWFMNISRYKGYWKIEGGLDPLVIFWIVQSLGYILYFLVVLWSYKKYWSRYFSIQIYEILKNLYRNYLPGIVKKGWRISTVWQK